MNTQHRLNYFTAAGDAIATMMPLSRFVHDESGLDEKLLYLVQLRASQINGCAYCVVLHVNDARDAGDTDARLHAVAVWRDTPYFTDAERVALELTEALTTIPGNEIGDDLYARALAAFGERGTVMLTLAIASIGVWNRLNIMFRTPPSANARTKAMLAHAS